jgi:integrase/recombinase XerD
MTNRIGDTWEELLNAHCDALKERNYSEVTLRHRRYNMQGFFAFAVERGLTHPREVTLPVLNRYRKYLFEWRSHNVRDNGKPLSFRTQFERLSAVRTFFSWLVKERRLLYNPASDLDLPRMEKRLPRGIMSAEQMETVLHQPNVAVSLGLRDRAILETMYSTACRRTELTKIAVHDVDFNHGMLRIRFGKGGRERIVPIGDRALIWIEKYLQEARPSYVADEREDTLFLSNRSKGLTPKELSHVVAKHMSAAGIREASGCHTIRHTAATVMLRAGADTRHIQEFLGHAQLSSTQIYTRVAPVNLKAIHNRFHPAAKLKKKREEQAEEIEP